jgi:hypothetical protein
VKHFLWKKNETNSLNKWFAKYVGNLLQRHAWWGQVTVWQERCDGASDFSYPERPGRSIIKIFVKEKKVR